MALALRAGRAGPGFAGRTLNHSPLGLSRWRLAREGRGPRTSLPTSFPPPHQGYLKPPPKGQHSGVNEEYWLRRCGIDSHTRPHIQQLSDFSLRARSALSSRRASKRAGRSSSLALGPPRDGATSPFRVSSSPSAHPIWRRPQGGPLFHGPPPFSANRNPKVLVWSPCDVLWVTLW